MLAGSLLLSAVLTLAGGIVAVLALYLVALAIASFHRVQASLGIAGRALLVLVPAHNEEELIGRCVTSLFAQTYPRSLYRVAVVADNCQDATASIARKAGAEVLVRMEPASRGKGRALRWAMDKLVPDLATDGAVVIVDADSVADPHLLARLAAALQAGHDVVQADYEVLSEGRSPRSEVAAVAFMLFHRVRLSGRAALGMPASLVGNGMLLSRRVLERYPWNAFSAVEDLEMSLNLRVAGIKPWFASDACVYGPLPSSAATDQRVRWEGGRWTLVRTRLISLLVEMVKCRRPDLLDVALDLAVPPLGLLVLVSSAGTAVTALAVWLKVSTSWSIGPWLVAVAAIPAFVVLGLWSAGAPPRMFLALLSAPRFLVWKIRAYFRILRGFDPERWEPHGSTRPQPVRGGERFEVADVRIDPVDLDGAIDRIEQALGGTSLFQVSTVNLDFLVRAQQSSEVRAVFRRSALNVADGTPVVWLGRLLGNHVPERVAGADLVPRLMKRLSVLGASVFFLGGENGVALEAARRLERAIPGLRIAGCFEPPHASIEEMDRHAILERIAESGADVLLVAFGHPKQELWIDRHRDQLPCRVAIGVGCVFDLIAGRSRRAPMWMQRSGLEWLHRLSQEPGRLLGRYVTDSQWLMLITLRIFWQRLRMRTA